MEDFCDQAQKIASRNCPARADHLRLLEEELFLGTLLMSQKLDHADLDLMHRARSQISEQVVTLRREIKDLRPGDEDYDDEDDEAEFTPPSSNPSSKRPQETAHSRTSSVRAKLERSRSPRRSRSVVVIDDSDDDEVVEIPRPTLTRGRSRAMPSGSSRRPAKPPAPTNRFTAKEESSDSGVDEGYASDSSSIVEIARPDPRLTIIKNAYNATLFAFETLTETDGPAPYGVRLFALVALDILLGTIRLKTGPVLDEKGDAKGAQAAL